MKLTPHIKILTSAVLFFAALLTILLHHHSRPLPPLETGDADSPEKHNALVQQQYSLAVVEHSVQLRSAPGLPAKITVAKNIPEIEHVDALFEIDNRLLRLPLQYQPDSDSFVANFPSPHSSLYYQLVFELSAGRTAMSERFHVTSLCGQTPAPPSSSSDASTPRESDQLQTTLDQLNFILATLNERFARGKVTSGNSAL